MLLDTDILIDIARRHLSALSWFATLTVKPHVSGYSAMEIVNCCRNKEELKRAQKFISSLPLIWPSVPDLEGAMSDYAPMGL
jgi:hypothetical protein